MLGPADIADWDEDEADRLRAEIEYIARTNHERCPEMGTLRIADPNFGMYSRDVDISETIGHMQKRYGWPTFIDATTGKTLSNRVLPQDPRARR